MDVRDVIGPERDTRQVYHLLMMIWNYVQLLDTLSSLWDGLDRSLQHVLSIGLSEVDSAFLAIARSYLGGPRGPQDVLIVPGEVLSSRQQR